MLTKEKFLCLRLPLKGEGKPCGEEADDIVVKKKNFLQKVSQISLQNGGKYAIMKCRMHMCVCIQEESYSLEVI